MGRNIKDQKRNSDLDMEENKVLEQIVIIVDQNIDNHICMKFMDKKQFKEWLSACGCKSYFINVSDKIWEYFGNKNSIRFDLKTKDINGVIGNPSYEQINEIIAKAIYLLLIDDYEVKYCMYYPKDDIEDDDNDYEAEYYMYYPEDDIEDNDP